MERVNEDIARLVVIVMESGVVDDWLYAGVDGFGDEVASAGCR
jgi:hypothetical protein